MSGLLWELKKEARVKEGDIVEGNSILKIKRYTLLREHQNVSLGSVKPAKKLKNKLYNPGRV
mgnify:CR=1 FL=1